MGRDAVRRAAAHTRLPRSSPPIRRPPRDRDRHPRPAAAPASPEPRPEKAPRVISFSHRLSRWDLKLSPYLYISPFFILFAIVGLFPIVFTAIISFQEWDLVRNSGTFVGFDQYIWILNQPAFWTALRNTFSIFLLSTIPQMILAIFIAAMLDRNIRAKTFWRMSVLLPFVMAPVAVALIFSNMFGDNHGLVNNILDQHRAGRRSRGTRTRSGATSRSRRW